MPAASSLPLVGANAVLRGAPLSASHIENTVMQKD